jgi:hypothetical protein
MGFSCRNEVAIAGGKADERNKAAALIAAEESVDEDSLSREEGDGYLSLRFESVDGMPEEEISILAAQFPELAFTLVYFSRDGEFCGYAKAGRESAFSGAESEDLDEAALGEVGSRYDGDGLAYVRARYGLERARP